MITASIVADSKNEFGDRITSYIITFPRFILAELNTHRLLSKNSASSRAIPFKKMVKQVKENPFIPIRFQKDHPGMQGTEYFTGWREEIVRKKWLWASKAATFSATMLHRLGVTKQLANRILEPFLWHTVLITGTEWENFFALRHHRDADIHIQELARVMLEAANASAPKLLKEGEWHMPFGNEIDNSSLLDLLADKYAYDDSPPTPPTVWNDTKLQIATARCARLSYTGLGDNPVKHDYAADLDTFGSLLTRPYTNRKGQTWTEEDPIHASPAEHCAEAMGKGNYFYYLRKERKEVEYGWCGNFKGFIQLRKMIPDECKKDARLIKK